MTFLSDRDIRRELMFGDLLIEPLREGSVQPASIDLHLGGEMVFHRDRSGYAYHNPLDTSQPLNGQEWIGLKADFGILMPGTFYLGTTVERVRIPANMVGRLEGKSSLGRLGITVHATAGYIDPGFDGQITLEITNHLGSPVRLYPGMAISQLSLAYLNTAAEHPYAGKYQGQTGPQLSQIHKNFTEAK